MGKDGASISDEEWERFLRESEAGTHDAPEEPSARARMVTRRLRDEPGPPEGWRTHRPPARRLRGNGWYAVGLLVAIGLFVVALNPGWVTGWFGGAGGRGESGSLAAESEQADRPTEREPEGERPTADQPFRGSPATEWGDGIAGIDLPEARATGWMSKEQVARAIGSTRDFLAASNLDPGVLRGQRPEQAIALINPHQKDVQNSLVTAFRKPTAEDDPLLLFSRFAPSKVRLVGDVVKTRGLVTYREAERGAVEMTTDVTYVYPVVRAAAGSDEVARTIVRREIVMSWDDPEKVVVEPGTFSLVSYKVDIVNGGCGENRTGYYAPAFAAERAVAGPRDGTEVDPYDRSVPLDALMRDAGGDGCRTATRS
ncbi:MULTISPECIES: hypothetical protein [unclassified Streptomyces]|uniref:hypothetical protein n=1 Tax=unclassified Streptomyces TaxID=2593676 RepID=UPI003325B879